jgi:hypothetical protein
MRRASADYYLRRDFPALNGVVGRVPEYRKVGFMVASSARRWQLAAFTLTVVECAKNQWTVYIISRNVTDTS